MLDKRSVDHPPEPLPDHPPDSLPDADREVSRRAVLRGIGALAAGTALAACTSGGSKGSSPSTTSRSSAPTSTTRPGPPLRPGSLPNPRLPAGTDTLPKIEHIIVLMLENHSFDDHFGMLGRGDGFRLGPNGRPIDANPYTAGKLVEAFHMPSSCQLNGAPSQAWVSSHAAWNNGRNDGFVKASGPVAMGYWNQADIPFYYGLGRTFPVSDRWFCSTLAQTYPNRRFLVAGTAAGIITTSANALLAPPPPHGTIFERLDAHGISWHDYYNDLPGAAVVPSVYTKNPSKFSKIDRFAPDAAAGRLPSVCFVDPNFSHQSEEDPQDIRLGEQFAAMVINAVMHGPAWDKTLLIWTYDEHGGYYDHVAPPKAIKPDNIAPGVDVSAHVQGAYDRYGFRVPAVIVSPYARKNYVSHVVHDHTSVLKLIETKWNLPALTYRDANADNLLDSLDLEAKRPPFAEPPTLPAPALAAGPDSCTEGHPGGSIPPASAIVRAGASSPVRIGAT